MFDKQLLIIPSIRKVFGVCICASFADALIVAAQCITLANAIVGIWSGKALSTQLVCIAGFFAFFVLRKIAANAQAAFIDKFAAKTRENLEDDLLKAIFKMGPIETNRYGTAAMVSNLIEGTSNVEEYLRLIIPRTITVLIVPLVLLCFMFSYDWISGLIALIMYPFIIIFMRLIGSSAKAEATRRHRQFERMSNNFLDTAAGVDTLNAFGAGPAFSESIFRASEKFRHLTMKTLRIAMLSSTVLDIFSTLALAAVAIMLGFRLVEGTLDFLPALIVLMMVPDYFKPIKDYGSNYHATLDGKTALDAILGVITHAEQINDVISAPEFDIGTLHHAELTLADICYNYNKDSDDKDSKDTSDIGIENINLCLRAPCKIGIFGESGAGKSTLLNILAGFISPDSGNVVLNGSKTGTLKIEQWLRRIAYIPQKPYIFHATLRDNLTFYNPSALDSEIDHAIEAMGLRKLIEQLPNGLDTKLGKGGRTLSGGQAQRVAVARALIDPTRDVWILDEPTAHLDIETEYELKAHLLPLMENKLVILATHRTHWKADMDICVFMSDGSIVKTTGGGAL